MTKEPPDLLGKAATYIENHQFKEAASELTGNSSDQDEANDELLGVFAKLFSAGTEDQTKIKSTLSEIYEIYLKNKSNVPELKLTLNTFLAKFGKAEGMPLSEQALGDLSTLDDRQIAQRIEECKKEQQTLIKTGKTPDENLGEKLRQLLDEQNKRAGNIATTNQVAEPTTPDNSTSEASSNGTDDSPEGADDWFVVPSNQEQESEVHIYVVCGSPIITVLRNRYRMEYKLAKVPDTEPRPGAIVSADEDYEFKRERIKQRDFASNYVDPSLISDQDMFAQEAYEEFTKPEYKKPQCVLISDSMLLYRLESGILTDSSASKGGKHSFSLSGKINGRFAICLQRREPQSGRMIADAYDIIEFQDNAPSFYFYSSKGVSSLSKEMLKSLLMALKIASYSLDIPLAAVPSEELTGQALIDFIKSFKQTVQDSLDADTAAAFDKATQVKAETKAEPEAGPPEAAKSEPTPPEAAKPEAVPPEKTQPETTYADTLDQPLPTEASQDSQDMPDDDAPLDDGKETDEKRHDAEVTKIEAKADGETGATPAQDEVLTADENELVATDGDQVQHDEALDSEEESDLISDDEADEDDQSDEADEELARPDEAEPELALARRSPTATAGSEEAEAVPETESDSDADAEDEYGTEDEYGAEDNGASPEAGAETEEDQSTLESHAIAQATPKSRRKGMAEAKDNSALAELKDRVDSVEEIIINNVKTLDELETRVSRLEASANLKGKASADEKENERLALKKMANSIKKSLAHKKSGS